MVTTLMYHYVRNIKNSNYPNIRGLETNLFLEQLKYLKKYYYFVSYNDLLESIYAGKKLKKNSVILTFDDGFIDNYLSVFPILIKENIKAIFYPISSTISKNIVADVHKIHFILENFNNVKKIKNEVKSIINNLNKNEIIQENFEEIYCKLAFANEDDNKNVIFIKRIFQHYLEPKIRSEILDDLFKKYVSNDEKNFAKKLYLNVKEIKEMSEHGMTFGNHTFSHKWLGKIKLDDQKNEIENCLDFLDSSIKNFSRDNWTISYPYGSFDNDTLEICEKAKCKIGFTTVVDISNTTFKNRLKLERLDTNNIPKNSKSLPNKWTRQILG